MNSSQRAGIHHEPRRATNPPGFGGKISAVDADPRMIPSAEAYAGLEPPMRSVDGPVMAGP